MDSDGKLSVKLVSATAQTEGKVYMAISSADVDDNHNAENTSHDAHSLSLTTNLALDGVLEPSHCIPIRTVSSGSTHNRISIFRAGSHELLARTFDVCGVMSGSTIVRFYFRYVDCCSFLSKVLIFIHAENATASWQASVMKTPMSPTNLSSFPPLNVLPPKFTISLSRSGLSWTATATCLAVATN
jgi:hypothetical protein